MGVAYRLLDEILPFGSKASTRSDSIYRVQVLDRALEILGTLSDSDVDLGPSDLAAKLRLHKSTIHRLLKVLERHRLVSKSESSGRYGLGTRLSELGMRASARHDFQQRAEPYMRELAEATGESSYVSILDGTESVSVGRVDGPWTPWKPSTVGKRSPVYCTSSGKAMIAFLPEPYLDDLLRRLKFVPHTPNTLRNRIALEAELCRVRERGYAVDHEEIEPGLRCVGGPIRDSAGAIVASIGIAGPIFRMTERRLPAVARTVLDIAHRLSEDVNIIRPSKSSSYVRARRSP
jgi:DNA-binding IclR family transcriptional regulator